MSRKQREIANRHNLFLDISRGILDEDGFHLLSMEAVADAAEYSKGTVYQHFTCKEEILMQLCVQDMTELHELFLRAAQFDGSNRDRIVALSYAHLLWSRIGCKKTDMHQQVFMHGVRDKVSNAILEQHDELHDSIVGLALGIVNDALQAGELTKSKNMLAPDIVFGLWALFSGGQTLQTSELPLEEMGISDPDMTILRNMMLMLDGLKWQPLHNEAHLKKILTIFNTKLFAEEYAVAINKTD